ncbi:MAG: two-component system response regulator HydG [Desulforhopalus sp.]|jgi:two-component system response regulator HydG
MKSKILVVDDEESIRFTFNIFLTEADYEVDTVANYEEAVALIKEVEYDLIYTDIFMERESGIDLLKKSISLRPTTPIVMITGVPSVETAAESLRVGALDYIIKPVCQDTLLRVTTMALKHRALAKEKERCRLNFEAIFRSVKDGIITLGEGMIITEINDAITQICGVQRQDVLGERIQELAKYCDGRCLNTFREVFEKKKLMEVRLIECNCSKKQSQVVNLTASPLIGPGNELTGVVMVIKDETHLHELKRKLQEYREFDPIVGMSEGICNIKNLIRELANVRTTVLITGESGTGKELVVDALHRTGYRQDMALIKVNCAALSDTLLESELFGHVRGAFTGAVRNKMGRFESADGGTIFLDEIGDISSYMQSRLLRVIESGEFERVGESNPLKVDVRVVAATNQDLPQKVARGEFREDLYYRLKVVEIKLPPLRERRSDIPMLLNHFLKKFNCTFGMSIKDVSTDVFNILMMHNWPGNIRELANTLEHAFVRCHQDIITLKDLPPEFKNIAQQISSAKVPVNEQEEARRIRQALLKTDWNKSKAAELLGISRRTIYRKIDLFSISSKN